MPVSPDMALHQQGIVGHLHSPSFIGKQPYWGLLLGSVAQWQLNTLVTAVHDAPPSKKSKDPPVLKI
jgi:hypothetical protein